jgi:hypothetical protein
VSFSDSPWWPRSKLAAIETQGDSPFALIMYWGQEDVVQNPPLLQHGKEVMKLETDVFGSLQVD